MAKNYIRGSARERVFEDDGGSLVNFSVNVNDLAKLADEKGWVQLVMTPKRETDPYGNTHSMYLNEYKPPVKEEVKDSAPDKENDLPF